MSAAQESGHPSSRWPVHLMQTAPVEQRRRSAEPEARPRTSPAARAPQRAAGAPTQRPRTPVQRTAVLPPQPLPPQPSAQQYRAPRPQGAPPPPTRRSAGARSRVLTAPQLRRRWVGGIASAVLVGATLPVQLGAVALESLELLSPGPDGSARPVVLAAIGVQLVVVLLPMLIGPAIGGFTRRWRARLIVLGANATLVGIVTLLGWLRVSQS